MFDGDPRQLFIKETRNLSGAAKAAIVLIQIKEISGTHHMLLK